MVRTSLLLVPLVAVASFWMGQAAEGPGVVVVAVGVGAAVAVTIHRLAGARVRRLSVEVNAWMGKTEILPVDLRAGREVDQLATAINSLGAAYARRGKRLLTVEPRPEDLVLALPEPALLFGADLLLVAANQAAVELFHVAEPGSATTATSALGSPVLADLARAVAGGRGAQHETVVVGASTIHAVATPFAGQVLFLARDLTEQLRVESVRRDFVANASHELRTPVAGIQSLSDAMDVVLERDPAKARELLDRIRMESERLGALVADLLSLRRVDEGLAEPGANAEVSVDLAAVARSAVAGVEAVAVDRGISIEVDAGESVWAKVLDEDARLFLANLVDNAVKYNRPGGSVRVVLRREGARAVVEVIDTGIGVPAKDLSRIFERFYRVDPGRSRQAGGTGLGLSLVRHAVERNGGTVEVSSLLGTGTTFRVVLPAASPVAEAEGTVAGK